ncbi:glycosyl hydrolase family 95 catalytic domain-containing protein [Streptomyces sp. CA-243310]|uniref:glycosyl hydrolase family 95 catalytic domain-containing protein n=1 Tax=Streptomyces sp. CA-243310 TaxID=3240056 RepID=UPI003D8B7A25
MRRPFWNPARTGLLAAALVAATLIPVSPPGASAATTPDPNTLWYAQPASGWEAEALPIGNGSLGAMVFGGVGSEQLQFNEKTLWTGGPGSPGYNHGNWTSPRPNALNEVVDRINTTGKADPDWVAGKLGQSRSGYGAHQTFGDLRLDMADADPGYSGYRRSLDISNALAKVRYTSAGVVYDREYFAGYPGNVVAGRLGANKAGKVSFTLRYTSPRNDFTTTANGGRLTIRGELADNGLAFESQVRIATDGGTVTSSNGQVKVSGADSAVFVMSAATYYAQSSPTYRGPDPHAKVTAAVDAAVTRSYTDLKASHIADHRALFDRVRLDVGGVMPDSPTNQLLAGYTTGTSPADRALETLFYQYGRYLLIASSRPGSLPANLQGVWNNSATPPWSGDYHTNINLQMNYWQAAQANLAETAEPFTAFVEDLKQAGTSSATQMFGSLGWVVHNETNPFGFTGVHDWSTAFWFPEANGWLASQVYDLYRFNQDKAYLRDRAYPLLKGAAEFWLANLRTDPRGGRLVVTPSYSPEHGDFTSGGAMAQQIVQGLLTDTLAAAEELHTDTDLQGQLTAALGRLDPGLRVGSWGQLQEWKADLDDPSDTHRHVSHLYALHPGHQISPDSDPQFTAAARVSLNARGDGGTGWSKAWKINFWARLLDGDHAHKLLTEQLKNSTLSNLFDTHPPFQIDGNFGASSGMTEMLVQSQNGEIRMLPALPSTWASGSVTGLKARGDVTVGAVWQADKSAKFTLMPGNSGPLTVRSSLFTGSYSLVDTTTGQAQKATRSGDRMTFTAVAGHTYRATGTLAVVPQSGSTYTLTSPSSGKAADVRDGSTADGAAVIQYAPGGAANQKWKLADAGNGAFTLAAAHSGKCLEVPSDAIGTEGTGVRQWSCGAGDQQQWRFEPAGQDTYRLVSVAGGGCLDVPGASTADGAQLIQWTCSTTAANQKWRLTRVG